MSPRNLTLALFLSLAVNLFVIGAVVGMFLIGHRLHGVAEAPRRPQPLWAAADELPTEHRDAYRQLLQGQAMGVGLQIRQARKARRDAFAALGQEPLDPTGVSKRLADARTLEVQARGEVESRIVDFAASLPPAERAELAHGLVQSAPGPMMGMRRMRPMGEEPPPPGPDAQ
ncbi:periplasmic heavy metal sensor [Phenylobacterium aquaticum]|uniref:periplasmic heavy metal sensor n=1 Tax=Phenylobacterium aquaticum TaxID=1763816 RepID=UPI0026ECC95B|nr:periplasmic heavy metal sensor [Phenylobacterium aquaticum]